MERRKAKRFFTHPLKIYVTIQKNIFQKKDTGLVKNISTTGLLIECHLTLPFLSKINLQIVLPKTNEIINTTARVVRLEHIENNMNRIGVEFLKIKEEDRKRLTLAYFTKHLLTDVQIIQPDQTKGAIVRIAPTSLR
jgi:c-di-GMP-binding flagellar brake protein YcgR